MNWSRKSWFDDEWNFYFSFQKKSLGISWRVSRIDPFFFWPPISCVVQLIGPFVEFPKKCPTALFLPIKSYLFISGYIRLVINTRGDVLRKHTHTIKEEKTGPTVCRKGKSLFLFRFNFLSLFCVTARKRKSKGRGVWRVTSTKRKIPTWTETCTVFIRTCVQHKTYPPQFGPCK